MEEKRPAIDRIASECVLRRVRLVSRVLSGIFDEELRPLGLRASQLPLLVAIAKSGPARRSDIGRQLHLDPSTLTRNLKVMIANGWVEEEPHGRGGRGHPLRVTEAGSRLLAAVEPAWEKGQARARELIGPEGESMLRRLSGILSGP